MINLLSKSEQRRLDLARALSGTNQWLTLKELSSSLKSSSRVLQNDLDYFENQFDHVEVLTSHKGVRLLYKKGHNLKAIIQTFLEESNAYKLLEDSFLYEGQSIQEVAQRLSISVATVYRLVDQINEKTAAFDFKLDTKPYRLIGDEEKIRYFLYQYFEEKYDYLDMYFHGIDNESMDEFLGFFLDFTQMPADFAFYNIFKLISSINTIRYKNEHFIDTSDISINFAEIIPSLNPYREIFSNFEEKLEVELSTQFIHQIFTPYVQDGFSLSIERFYKKAEHSETTAASISLLESVLTNISKRNKLPLTNIEEIIWALHNSAHLEYQEPKSGYIFYNKNKYFAEDIRFHFPLLHKTLYEGMKTFRKFLNKSLTDDGINFFIFTAFTFWENIIPELNDQLKKVKILVMNDRHTTHASMIKDFIIYKFSNQIIVDIYKDNHIYPKQLETLNYDLIVTNFPLPALKKKPIVYIENVPKISDLQNVQQAVQTILEDRLNAK